MKKYLAYTTLTAVLTISACGSDDDNNDTVTDQTVFGKSYSLISGTPDVGTNLEGTGIVSFGDSMIPERAGETNFLFTIDISQDDSSVALHTFSNEQLQSGQIVTFSKDTDQSLVITYQEKDGSQGTIRDLASIDTTQPITMSLEIHNGEDNGSHVILWEGDDLPSEPVEYLDGFFGTGKFLGLNVSNAVVSQLEIGPAEVAE